jgi:hypothetical protein
MHVVLLESFELFFLHLCGALRRGRRRLDQVSFDYDLVEFVRFLPFRVRAVLGPGRADRE